MGDGLEGLYISNGTSVSSVLSINKHFASAGFCHTKKRKDVRQNDIKTLHSVLALE
jgi:hypothetical protein